MNNIGFDEVNNALSYDPESGRLIWKERSWVPKRTNTMFAGKEAGSINRDGYVCISLTVEGNPIRLFAHNIVWMISTGSWPADELDHRDTDPGNNRFENLRIATHSQNLANRKSYGRSTFKGVRADRRTGRWQALITLNKKQTHLGMFDTPEEAHVAYKAEAERRHGEFAYHKSAYQS